MKKYRNEWKFILPEATLSEIEARLQSIMDTDRFGNENGYYTIKSLYLDDHFDTSVYENEAGIGKRFKYRIRYYNDNPDYLKLERKEKENGLCYKESCLLSKNEYEAILTGSTEDFLYESDKPLLQKFGVDCMTRGYMPKAIIEYERVAFVEEITNVRVTIDRNISASNEAEGFLTGDYLRFPLQEKQRHILEIKFDDILPSYIRNVLNENNLVQTSFSKYYLGRQQLNRQER